MNLTTTTLGIANALTVVVVFGLLITVSAVDTSAEEHTVEIRNLQFIPSELTVAPGDTITWINYDFIPHTVTADDKSWDSGLIEADGKWETFVKKGMFTTYFCQYHPNMKARLLVVQE